MEMERKRNQSLTNAVAYSKDLNGSQPWDLGSWEQSTCGRMEVEICSYSCIVLSLARFKI